MINSLPEVRLNTRARFLFAACGFFAITMAGARDASAQATPAVATLQSDPVTRIDLPVGRAYPLTTPVAITKVSITNSEIADVIVISAREMVVNAKAAGETDALMWLANGVRQHFRIAVHSPSDRLQIALYLKFAEVRKDFLRTVGVSAVYRNDGTRVGTSLFNTDAAINPTTGVITLPGTAGFGTVLTDFSTKHLLALLDVEESHGRARTLAEPNLLAGNKDSASFLAGGEVPIPIIQSATGTGVQPLTVQYK